MAKVSATKKTKKAIKKIAGKAVKAIGKALTPKNKKTTNTAKKVEKKKIKPSVREEAASKKKKLPAKIVNTKKKASVEKKNLPSSKKSAQTPKKLETLASKSLAKPAKKSDKKLEDLAAIVKSKEDQVLSTLKGPKSKEKKLKGLEDFVAKKQDSMIFASNSGKSAQPKAESQAQQTAPKEVRPAPKPSVPPPMVNIIICGGISVYWLTADAQVHASHIQEQLHESEIEFIKSLRNDKRKIEFERSRWLFHKMSKRPDPLLNAERGQLILPDEIVCSLSHSGGNVAMALGSREVYLSMGIDVERLSRIDPSIERKISSAEESAIIDRVEALTPLSRVEILGILFSCKEAVFKTYFPHGSQYFSFLDIEMIDFLVERRELKIKMKKDTSTLSPEGHVATCNYNWAKSRDGERFILATCEERKAIVVEGLVEDVEEEVAKPAGEALEELELVTDTDPVP